MRRIIIEPFERFSEKVLQFLQNFLTAILILISGIVLGIILKVISLRLFRAINLERGFDRSGVSEVLKKGGIREPITTFLSRIIGWITILTFSIISLHFLDVPAVERLLEKLFLYLPNVFVAVVILFFGYLLSNFLGRAVLIASVNAGWKAAGLIGKFVRLTVFILSVTMALEQLGIGRETIIIAFAIVFGGIVLALAIAFGLGGRDIAKEYLEKKIKSEYEEKNDEIRHL